MTILEALSAQQLGIKPGDRVGYRFDGKFETAIVLAVNADGLIVDDGLYYGILLRWCNVLPGF